jgi:RNA polymerase sigma-70 factor (ECF subfamily)
VAGDDRARFSSLYDECFPAVVAFARRRCPPDDAADVVAETFLVAWRRLPDVPDGRALPWLYGVARRAIANQRRGSARRRRLARRLAAELGQATPPPREPADLGLRRALARLAPDDLEVLRLAAWEGLAPADIATVLGCSANAASVRLHRARARLRALLAEGDAGTDGTGAVRSEPSRTRVVGEDGAT